MKLLCNLKRWPACLLVLVCNVYHAQSASQVDQAQLTLTPAALLQTASISNGRLTITIKHGVLVQSLFPQSTWLPEALDIIGEAGAGSKDLPQLDIRLLGMKAPAFSLPAGEWKVRTHFLEHEGFVFFMYFYAEALR